LDSGCEKGNPPGGLIFSGKAIFAGQGGAIYVTYLLLLGSVIQHPFQRKNGTILGDLGDWCPVWARPSERGIYLLEFLRGRLPNDLWGRRFRSPSSRVRTQDADEAEPQVCAKPPPAWQKLGSDPASADLRVSHRRVESRETNQKGLCPRMVR